MAIEVEELFIQPFRDIVERGQQAIENADDDDDADRAKKLAKAGQSIVKEGQRALKRIQPLWDKQVNEHGDTFREAIRKNDDLDERRRKLEDILYDFEDFIDADTFEADKFAELQSAAKTFALDVIDTLKRMKLERTTPPPPLPRQPPVRRNAPRSLSQRSTGAPPPQPPPPLPIPPPLRDLPRDPNRDNKPCDQESGSRQSSPERPDSPTLGSPKQSSPVDRTLSTHTNVTRAHSVASNHSNGTGLDRSSTVTSKTSYTSSDIPPPPLKDVWAIPPRSTSFGPGGSEFRGMSQQENQNRQTMSSHRSSGTPSVIVSPTETTYNTPWGNNNSSSNNISSPLHQFSIPEDSSVDGVGYVNQITTYTNRVAIPSSTTTTSRSSPMFDPNSPMTQATSLFSSPEFSTRPSTSPGPLNNRSQYEHQHEQHLPLPVRSDTTLAQALVSPEQIERPQTSMTEFTDGLMLASEADSQNLPPPALAREPDLNIGPKSSIYYFKGFCDGAREVQKGPGPQGIKHTAGYGSGRAIGRCVRCEFNRELAEVKMDFDQDVHVNSIQSGVLFRPRFLWKSHLSTANTAGHMYGCLFCTAIGKVTAEGDATIFPNQAALFRHLARHPQPLPHVSGVTVLYGKVDKSNPHIEDYDIHFPDPPVARNDMPDPAQLASLPIATATKAHVLRPGEKRLVDPDGVDALTFYEGARVVGIEFPERFGGKWAYGWHDGARGAFPIKNVEIDLPRRNEFPLQGGRGYTGIVRWKWDPKDKESWLTLEKKETISNIGWIHKDHWCWSGTNSKGKFGVFPSSHVDPISVREELVFPVSRTNSSLSGGDHRSHGGKKSRGFFGVRRRVSSAAASVSSASTDTRDVREII